MSQRGVRADGGRAGCMGWDPHEVSCEDLLEESQNTYGQWMLKRTDAAPTNGGQGFERVRRQGCRVSDAPAVTASFINSFFLN